MTRPDGPSLVKLVPSVFLPSVIYYTGIGALLPVIPILAVRLSGSVFIGAAIVALLGVGRIVGDVPAGKAASRFGDRATMVVCALASMVATAAAILVGQWYLLAISVVAVGALESGFGLARQAYVTEQVPVAIRARAMSTLGGVSRIGLLIGPFIGSGLIHLWDLRASFWLAVATFGLTALVVFIWGKSDNGRGIAEAPIHAVDIVRRNAKLFLTLGSATVLIGAVRVVRNTVLPLWSDHIGMMDAQTSLIFGISGLADVLLFYPGGLIMDRHGRSWVGVPSMAIMGLSLFALPLTHSFLWLCVVAIALGLGNGIASGIVMTMAADVSPPEMRTQFLGVWRLANDTGGAAGPLVISAGVVLGTLSIGIWISAAAGLAAAAMLFAWIPRWDVHANHTTRRAAGLE